jgi:phospholipid/cholesterol/gamma-HCH transport system substrate-binding protein
LDNAQWADSTPKLLQAKIIQSLENANFLAGVGRPSDGLTNDFQLLIDLRSFQISLVSPPKAEIIFMAQIATPKGRIIDGRVFHGEAPVKVMDPASAVEALNRAFTQSAAELVQWTAQKML